VKREVESPNAKESFQWRWAARANPVPAPRFQCITAEHFKSTKPHTDDNCYYQTILSLISYLLWLAGANLDAQIHKQYATAGGLTIHRSPLISIVSSNAPPKLSPAAVPLPGT
jgi:hypothetical protein